MTLRLPAVACAVLFGTASCSGTDTAKSREPTVPARAATCGDALFAMMPAGAELVLEVDLARLRGNEVVGLLVERLERDHLRKPTAPGLSFAPFALMGLSPEIVARADFVVLAAYAVGTAEAGSLVLARGERLRDFEVTGVLRVDERTLAVGPKSLADRVATVARGESPALASDRQLLALRAVAMPENASGASVRLAARLGFDARVGLASRLDLDAPPKTISLWGDVADDLAVVAILGGEDKAEGARLATAAERWREAAARRPMVRRLLRGYLSSLMKVQRAGAEARVVFIIGPRLLGRLVRRIETGLGSQARDEL